MPSEVELIRDVEYGTGGGRPLKLHILRPEPLPDGPLPVLVGVHGGAWRGGSRDDGIQPLTRFTQRGYFCVSIEYRLSQEALFPAQIEDCKCAIRFLRAKADEFRLDPNRIGALGPSAGGHLAALLGTSGGVKELEGRGGWQEFSSRVNAVCDWCGPTDFLKAKDFPSEIDRSSPEAPEALLIGGSLEEHPEKAARANPITYITRDAPPFLIMHGDQDTVVPLNQSELLDAALKKAGVEVTLHIIKGAGHIFGGPEIDAMVNAFFDRHLMGLAS